MFARHHLKRLSRLQLYIAVLFTKRCISSDVTMPSRTITQNVLSVEQDEGLGARVRRSVGRSELRNLDPFLMLDEFKVKSPAGFPDHPHRGFETVTYMLDGAFEHEDFAGNRGVIGPGDLQWMTAGRGILHCEMPHGEKTAHGLQLWVNLKSTEKMVEPAYQELLDKQIPRQTEGEVTVKIIAGESLGVKSPVYTRTPTMYLDFYIKQGGYLTQQVPAGWNGFVYVLHGQAHFGPKGSGMLGEPHHTLVLSSEEPELYIENTTSDECRFVLIAGQPIGEPIVQHGPFVMNTQEQIKQTISDYRRGQNGFEKAREWNSFVGREEL